MAVLAYPTLLHLSSLELNQCQPNVFFAMQHVVVHMGISHGLVFYSLMQKPQSNGHLNMLLVVWQNTPHVGLGITLQVR